MRDSPGCYCVVDYTTGETNGYTCNFCVNLLLLLKNAIVDEKNELVRENNELRFENSLNKVMKEHQGLWEKLANG